MNQQQFDGVLRRCLETATWHSVPWEYFVDMNRRLISPPQTNFEHWDYIEKSEIETYLNRCFQLRDEKFMPPDFYENWKNLKVALDFCESLRQKWQPMPMQPTYPKKEFPIGVDPFYDMRQNEERPIKQAIREGKVIDPWGSNIGNPKIIETCKKCLEDLDRCIQIKDESKPPVEMTVQEYKAHRDSGTLFSHYLKAYNQTDRLELKPD